MDDGRVKITSLEGGINSYLYSSALSLYIETSMAGDC